MKDSTHYVRDTLRNTNYSGPYYRIDTVHQADEVKAFLNNPQNTRGKSMRDMRTGVPYWNEQEVEYVRSNLGLGFLWYFLCNHCGHRAKYLYEYSTLECPLCRPCLGIDYERRKTRRQRPQDYPEVIQRTGPIIDERRKKPGKAIFVHADKEEWWSSTALNFE